MFDGRSFVRLDSHVSNMFEAGMRTTLAQQPVSIVWFVFDQTCLKRLATHFNISMFGHQTMFDGVWSPDMFDMRLSKRTKHRPSNTRTKEMFYAFDRMLDGLQI